MAEADLAEGVFSQVDKCPWMGQTSPSRTEAKSSLLDNKQQEDGRVTIKICGLSLGTFVASEGRNQLPRGEPSQKVACASHGNRLL